MSCIYALCDPDTCEVRYIGKTVQVLEARLRGHRRMVQQGSTRYVYNWLRSAVRPRVWVLETNPSDLYEAEQAWIARGRELGWRLTNLTDGGPGTTGYLHTRNTRSKISATLMGHLVTDEARSRMSESHRGQSGHPISPEQKLQISAVHKGKTTSPDTRNKISMGNWKRNWDTIRWALDQHGS